MTTCYNIIMTVVPRVDWRLDWSLLQKPAGEWSDLRAPQPGPVLHHTQPEPVAAGVPECCHGDTPLHP